MDNINEFTDSNSKFNRGLDEYLEDQRQSYIESMHVGDLHGLPHICVGCGKTADQLQEYKDMANPDSQGYEGYSTPDEAVRRNEGTFNRENNHFWCTTCYIKAGMPLGVAP
jgi:hypothetical protein